MKFLFFSLFLLKLLSLFFFLFILILLYYFTFISKDINLWSSFINFIPFYKFNKNISLKDLYLFIFFKYLYLLFIFIYLYIIYIIIYNYIYSDYIEYNHIINNINNLSYINKDNISNDIIININNIDTFKDTLNLIDINNIKDTNKIQINTNKINFVKLHNIKLFNYLGIYNISPYSLLLNNNMNKYSLYLFFKNMDYININHARLYDEEYKLLPLEIFYHYFIDLDRNNPFIQDSLIYLYKEFVITLGYNDTVDILTKWIEEPYAYIYELRRLNAFWFNFHVAALIRSAPV